MVSFGRANVNMRRSSVWLSALDCKNLGDIHLSEQFSRQLLVKLYPAT